MHMKLDNTNIAIIQHLKNGRKSFKKISEALSITENTVRSRVNKMLEEGILEITGLVDPSFIPDHQLIISCIRLKSMDFIGKAEEISKLRGVVSTNVVTGRYDVIVEVLLTKDFGLFEFISTELAKVKDILSIETFVVYKGINKKVPYTV